MIWNILITLILIFNALLPSALYSSEEIYIPANIDEEYFPEIVKFIKKYRCSAEVEKNKEQHFLKGKNYKRLINAERARRVIEINNLDLLAVPNKCLYEENGNLFVLSERVYPHKKEKKTLSASETKQLVTFAIETGFRDWVNNMIFDNNEKLTIIDTEDASFIFAKYYPPYSEKIKNLPARCKVAFARFLMVYSSLITPQAKKYFLNEKVNLPLMEPEAEAWFLNEIDKLINTDAGISETTILPNNPLYDDSTINFEKVKQEMKSIKIFLAIRPLQLLYGQHFEKLTYLEF